MGRVEQLSKRERRVLEAVIQTYVQTAEPAGSRTLARRFGLGVSPATIRSTMSDLEEKGFLFHPHASAGRVPTDVAYRDIGRNSRSEEHTSELQSPDHLVCRLLLEKKKKKKRKTQQNKKQKITIENISIT